MEYDSWLGSGIVGDLRISRNIKDSRVEGDNLMSVIGFWLWSKFDFWSRCL